MNDDIPLLLDDENFVAFDDEDLNHVEDYEAFKADRFLLDFS